MVTKTDRSLLSTVTDRAEKSFGIELKPMSKEQFDAVWPKWQEHWLKTAEEFRDELAAEGLVNTVAKMEEHIEWHKKYNITKDKINA